jgi:membrane-bound serine protease (ClpP class)
MRIRQRLDRLFLSAVALLFTAIAVLGQATDQSAARPIVLLAAIEGAIGPATVRHVEGAVAAAGARGAEALILRLYTPGGLADAMREISAAILSSSVPVVGYVAPPGAHAASAGTYILYATHIAAMAPGTNLGAATPVQIGGFPGAPSGEEEKKPDETPPAETEEWRRFLPAGDAMNAKATNDAVAFIRSLAEMHGRNADWAEKAVREAASLSATQALQEGVIDLMAEDVPTLLAAVDGRRVTIRGTEHVLKTRGAAVEELAPDTMTRLLGVLSNPNVALLLMMIGLYGLIFEFINPGSIGPGVVGAICLTLGLYALNQLPLDYAGLALVLLGAGFMVAEAFTPTFGVLGFGGLIAFIIGSAMLIDTDVPAYQVSWWMTGGMAALSGAVLVLLLGYTIRAYRRPALSADTAFAGETARVLEWSGATGFVWARGERWSARADRALSPGDPVRVRGIDGLTLMVEPIENPD